MLFTCMPAAVLLMMVPKARGLIFTFLAVWNYPDYRVFDGLASRLRTDAGVEALRNGLF